MPSPKKKKENRTQLDFPEAIMVVRNGGKITKLEWKNDKIYGCMNNGFLSLHQENGSFSRWLVNDGDMVGEDWVIV